MPEAPVSEAPEGQRHDAEGYVGDIGVSFAAQHGMLEVDRSARDED
jgi:hypothetical protein